MVAATLGMARTTRRVPRRRESTAVETPAMIER